MAALLAGVAPCTVVVKLPVQGKEDIESVCRLLKEVCEVDNVHVVYVDDAKRFAAVKVDMQEHISCQSLGERGCFLLGTTEGQQGVVSTLLTRDEGAVCTNLELPCCEAFMESMDISSQYQSAWKIARSLRRAGTVCSIEFGARGECTKVCIAAIKAKVQQDSDKKETNKTRPQKRAPQVNRTGWGGGGRVKTNERFTVFRTWIAREFGLERLQRGSGVLDVAGGKGELAFKLLNYGGVPTTIVDPRPMDVPNMLRHLSRDHIERLVKFSGGRTVKVPFPDHIRCWFWYPLLPVDDSVLDEKSSSIENYVGETLSNSKSERLKLLHAVESCSAIVGMHADQATEAIVDSGLHYNKPFAVVPCCVYKNLFPKRCLETGTVVATYPQLVQYLVEKDTNRIQTFDLPFSGRNKVIYGGGIHG
eukprot:CAMPEP_0203793738 /NCGR_PEP_ID=MMETSP0100_2-20121128/6044_1 /ASSEMBLY_ACC=CAM_ASM_000210 /TAXON_ID=96639 /ORGANISM=" , Strain NY0313808BC1" /LENGTH=418 /DNA_ID=CAMNT_0050697575 /DNA_START=336 /DNA_END=1592 /DNA_ORIENTATION=-